VGDDVDGECYAVQSFTCRNRQLAKQNLDMRVAFLLTLPRRSFRVRAHTAMDCPPWCHCCDHPACPFFLRTKSCNPPFLLNDERPPLHPSNRLKHRHKTILLSLHPSFIWRTPRRAGTSSCFSRSHMYEMHVSLLLVLLTLLHHWLRIIIQRNLNAAARSNRALLCGILLSVSGNDPDR